MRVAAAVAPVTMPPPVHAGEVCLRAGTDMDAAAIHALIASHVSEGRLLPRERGEIALHAHRFVVASDGDRVVACAELAPLSRAVSEVRSLVVSEEARSLGLGGEMLDALVERATLAGFEKVCAFTHAPSYFVRRGFSLVPHGWLPEKIVTNCHSCPLFRQCGQYAVMRELRRAPQACVPLAALHG
jgi:amino-acid N-acetyltransferase